MSDQTTSYPSNFNFSVNTYTDPEGSLKLEIQAGIIKGNIGIWPVNYNPSSMEWKAFQDELRKMNIWRWKSRYEFADMEIIDGTLWDLEIKWDANHVRSGGHTKFPRKFKQFVAALKTLTHYKEFD